jgi:hypothetical protein
MYYKLGELSRTQQFNNLISITPNPYKEYSKAKATILN